MEKLMCYQMALITMLEVSVFNLVDFIMNMKISYINLY